MQMYMQIDQTQTFKTENIWASKQEGTSGQAWLDPQDPHRRRQTPTSVNTNLKMKTKTKRW